MTAVLLHVVQQPNGYFIPLVALVLICVAFVWLVDWCCGAFVAFYNFIKSEDK